MKNLPLKWVPPVVLVNKVMDLSGGVAAVTVLVGVEGGLVAVLSASVLMNHWKKVTMDPYKKNCNIREDEHDRPELLFGIYAHQRS